MELETDDVMKNTRSRDKKVDLRANMDDQTRLHIKQLKLCYLEDDEVGVKEE